MLMQYPNSTHLNQSKQQIRDSEQHYNPEPLSKLFFLLSLFPIRPVVTSGLIVCVLPLLHNQGSRITMFKLDV